MRVHVPDWHRELSGGTGRAANLDEDLRAALVTVTAAQADEQAALARAAAERAELRRHEEAFAERAAKRQAQRIRTNTESPRVSWRV